MRIVFQQLITILQYRLNILSPTRGIDNYGIPITGLAQRIYGSFIGIEPFFAIYGMVSPFVCNIEQQVFFVFIENFFNRRRV